MNVPRTPTDGHGVLKVGHAIAEKSVVSGQVVSVRGITGGLFIFVACAGLAACGGGPALRVTRTSSTHSPSPASLSGYVDCPPPSMAEAAAGSSLTGPAISYGASNEKICRYSQGPISQVQVDIVEPATMADFEGERSAAASGGTVVSVPHLGRDAFVTPGDGSVEVFNGDAMVFVSDFDLSTAQVEAVAQDTLNTPAPPRPSAPSGIGAAVSAVVEGVPVPAVAKLELHSMSSGHSPLGSNFGDPEDFAQYLVPSVPVSQLDAWYNSVLPPGNSWRSLKACTKPIGIPTLPGEGIRRLWQEGDQATLGILTSSSLDGAVITISEDHMTAIDQAAC